MQTAKDIEQMRDQDDMLHVIVGGKDVLLRSTQIKEVVRPGALTAVPMAPDHLIGLANIHGQIVCIINVGKVSSLPSPSLHATARTRLLMLRHPVMHVGIWVDEVKRMQKIDRDLIAQSTASELYGNVAQLEHDGLDYALLDCSQLLQK
ncbi:cheW-like domain protein [Mariprofundus micogutta]|uniref:CheW-like domain protein n=1 Tax=Mariprofundus micogutta TaxID=1921010 RepID=A0A1L8CLV9_9PROT|nr:chemotaxis protein CheW [Mariprofundus micogutta]GAV19910.1 cheW-like domain protein [Mariprofundus micogutta]